MIYFVRHGQTDDNLMNLLTGWSDTSLNRKGLKQAKDAALQLKNINFDVCFCSPLIRTKQTLEEIKKNHKNLHVIYDYRLKERDYGKLTGKPVSDCKFRRWNANDKIPRTMESISNMYKRVASFYNEIKHKYANKNILIVSHSGVGRMSHFYFNGKPKDNDYSNFKIANSEIIEIEFEEKFMKEELILREEFIVKQIKNFLINKKNGNWHEEKVKTSALHGHGADIILIGGKRNSEKFTIECKGKSYAKSQNSINKEGWLNALGQIITRMHTSRTIKTGEKKGEPNRAYKYGLGLYWQSAQVALRRISKEIAQTLNLYIFACDDKGEIKQFTPSQFGKAYIKEDF